MPDRALRVAVVLFFWATVVLLLLTGTVLYDQITSVAETCIDTTRGGIST